MQLWAVRTLSIISFIYYSFYLIFISPSRNPHTHHRWVSRTYLLSPRWYPLPRITQLRLLVFSINLFLYLHHLHLHNLRVTWFVSLRNHELAPHLFLLFLLLHLLHYHLHHLLVLVLWLWMPFFLSHKLPPFSSPSRPLTFFLIITSAFSSPSYWYLHLPLLQLRSLPSVSFLIGWDGQMESRERAEEQDGKRGRIDGLVGKVR